MSGVSGIHLPFCPIYYIPRWVFYGLLISYFHLIQLCSKVKKKNTFCRLTKTISFTVLPPPFPFKVTEFPHSWILKRTVNIEQGKGTFYKQFVQQGQKYSQQQLSQKNSKKIKKDMCKTIIRVPKKKVFADRGNFWGAFVWASPLLLESLLRRRRQTGH